MSYFLSSPLAILSISCGSKILVRNPGLGNRTTHVYDGSGRLTKIVDPVGLETSFTYTGDRITAIIDPANRVTQLQYDDVGNLTKVIDPDISARTWEYDDKHHMIAEVDKKGDREETFYDLAGRVTYGIRKDGATVRVASSQGQRQGLYRPEETRNLATAPSAKPFSTTIRSSSYADGIGNVTTARLDQFGQIAASSDSIGSLMSVRRNENNLINERISERGGTTFYSYDERGNITKITDGSARWRRVLQGDSIFTEKAQIDGTGNYQKPILGDIDGDGIIDVVAIDSSPSAIEFGRLNILFGDGTGDIREQINFDAGSVLPQFQQPQQIELGDFNRDGKLDIAARTATNVFTFLGNGNGSFQPSAQFTFENTVLGFALGDLNSDNILDIVTIVDTNSAAEIVTHLGIGDGTFANQVTPVPLPSSVRSLEDVALGDVNGDNRLDIVLSESEEASFFTLLGRNDGSFEEAQNHITEIGESDEWRIGQIELADINEDGVDDVIVGGTIISAGQGYGADFINDAIVVRLGNRNGTLTPEKFYSARSSGFAISDVNGDNNLDIVTLGSDGIESLVGDGSGNFKSSGFRVDRASGSFSGSFLLPLADLDNDGDADIVIDLNGRLTTVLNGASSDVPEQTMTYDSVFNELEMESDELGRKTIYSIDPITGLRRSMTRVVGQVGGVDDVVTNYTYTSRGLVDTVTDPLGRVTDFDYNAFGRLEKVTYARGTVDEATTQYEYDAAGNQTAVVDENGNRTVQRYDLLNNRLEQVIAPDPDGSAELRSPVTSYTYDSRGNIISVKDARGNVTSYEYDKQDRLVAMTEPDLDGNGSLLPSVTTYSYDTDGNLLEVVTPLGQRSLYRYDARNRLVETVNPDSTKTRTVYNGNGSVIGSVDENGQWTQSYYDSEGRLFLVQDALGTTNYVYDDADQLIAEIDPNGHGTEYRYDALGRRIRVIDPRGRVSVTSYDKVGNVVQQTDRLTHTTNYIYDNRNRQTQRINHLGHAVSYGYDSVGNLLSETDPLLHTTRYTYDGLNRRVSVTDALSHTTTMTYDAMDNLVAVIDPLLRTTRYAYDAQNRRISVTDPLNQTTRYTYNAVDNLTSVVDPLGHRTRYSYDSRDRQISILDSMEHETRMTYDKHGNLESVTDPNHNTTVYQYDALNRKTLDRNELGYERKYSYDAVGNLVEAVDRNGRQRRFTYDENDRQQTEEWLDEEGSVVRTISYGYDDEGKLIVNSDLDSRYAYSYDAVNRLTTVSNAGTIGVPNVVLNYLYDNANRLTQTTDAIVGTVRGTKAYRYDAADRLTQVNESGSGVLDKRVNMDYSDANEMTRLTRYTDLAGTQLVAESTYIYDNASRLTTLQHQQGTSSLADYRFEYDWANRLTRMTSPDGTSNYQYDDRNQLTAAEYTDQADESYSYDATGNRTSDGHRTVRNNRLTSDGVYNYTYDREGNLTRKTAIATGVVTEYTWDYRNRLTQVIEQTATGAITQQANYTYDVNDRRIGKVVDPDGLGIAPVAVERMVYDGADIALVFDGTGTLTHRYLYGAGVDQVLSEETGGQVRWALPDQQGSVRDVLDSTGAIVNHLRYDSYGQVVNQTNSSIDFRYGYTGRDYDRETGLNYYRARYYDSRVGRFISEDPIAFNGGDVNLYRYVGNNPTNETDPSGLFIDTVFDVVSIIYDVYRIVHDNIIHGCDNLGENLTSLGLNAAGLLIPFATGLGAASRVARHADDIVDITRGASNLTDAGRAVDRARDASRAADGVGGAGQLRSGERLQHLGRVERQYHVPRDTSGASPNSGLGRGRSPSEPVGDYCSFVAGTKVLTPEGERNIEDIKVGDWVLADDPNTPGEIGERQVKHIFVHESESLLDLYVGGEKITTDDEHQFWVKDVGWVAANDLKEGMQLQRHDEGVVEVDRIERREGAQQVYNFEVEGFHTYFVSDLGVLVHNSGCNRDPKPRFSSERPGTEGPPVPDNRIVRVDPQPDGLTARGNRPLSVEDARRIVRRDGHVYVRDETTAREIAGGRGIGPETHPRDGESRFPHYHLPNREGGHIFFGRGQ